MYIIWYFFPQCKSVE